MHLNRVNKYNDFHICRTPLPHPKLSLININNLTTLEKICVLVVVLTILHKNRFHNFHLQAKCHYRKYPISWLWCIFCYIPVSNNLSLQIMMHIDLHCSKIWIVRLYIEIFQCTGKIYFATIQFIIRWIKSQ